MRYSVLVSGRSWTRRWSRQTWKLRPTGASGKTVQTETQQWQKTQQEIWYMPKYLCYNRVTGALVDLMGTKESAVMMWVIQLLDNTKNISFATFSDLSNILLCVFQGAPGEDGTRGEKVNRINIDFNWVCLCVWAVKIYANIFKIPFRANLERRGNKVPAETEVQGEI